MDSRWRGRAGAQASGGAARVLSLMARARRPFGRFHAGPRCTRADKEGHARCPRQRIGSPNLVNGWVGVDGLVRLRRLAGACAAYPPVRADRIEHTRTRWVGSLEMPLFAEKENRGHSFSESGGIFPLYDRLNFIQLRSTQFNGILSHCNVHY
jgi:hypothetical protein